MGSTWAVVRDHIESGLTFAWGVLRNAWPVLLLVALDAADFYERMVRDNLPWSNPPQSLAIPPGWSLIVVALALTWGVVRTYHKMRVAARNQQRALQVAKHVLREIADEGFELVGAGYEQPSVDKLQLWFDGACRVLGLTVNQLEANEQRRFCKFNGGLHGDKWGTILKSTAGFLAARAGQIQDSDLSVSFRPSDWDEFSISDLYSSGSDATSDR
jgi:hypothetical protein